MTANSMESGITEATKMPALKFPRNNTSTNMTISGFYQGNSMRFFNNNS
jgi:hypothetical protein